MRVRTATRIAARMADSKYLRICVGASAGGHMSQLLNLLDAAGGWPHAPDLYLTSNPSLLDKLRARGKAYYIGECNRRQPLRVLHVLLRTLVFALRERPDVVISTGAMPMALTCIWCKLLGAKIVWIDSIANIDRLSVSGKTMRRWADLFLVQWPELTQKYPGTEYVGELV